MKVKVLKKSIKITGISNESQMEIVDEVVEKSGTLAEYKDCNTTMIVTGDLSKFITVWNEI